MRSSPPLTSPSPSASDTTESALLAILGRLRNREAAVRNLRKDNKRLKKRMQRLEIENEELTEEVEALDTEKRALEGEIETLATENMALEEEIETLNTKNTALEKGIRILHIKNKAVKAELKQLNENGLPVDTKIRNLTQKNSALTDQNTFIRIENLKLKDRVDDLETKVKTLSTTVRQRTQDIRIAHKKAQENLDALRIAEEDDREQKYTIQKLRDEVSDLDLKFTITDRLLKAIRHIRWAAEDAFSIYIRDLIDKTQAYYAENIPDIRAIPDEGVGMHATPSQLWRGYLNRLSPSQRAKRVRELVTANRSVLTSAAQDLVNDPRSLDVLCSNDTTHRDKGNNAAHRSATDFNVYETAIEQLVEESYTPVFRKMLEVLKSADQ